MPDVRLSPSGPELTIELESDAIENESLVPGLNVTQALDYLFTASQWQLFDEFLGGTSATLIASQDGSIGELGWSFSTTGGQLARPATGDYIGAYEITADATFISGVRPGPDAGGSSATFPPATITLVEWIAQPVTITTGALRFGVGVNAAVAQFGNDGVFFEASPASPFWRVVARRSSSNTTFTTTVPWSNGSGVLDFVLARNSTTGIWQASIDGVIVVPSIPAANIPIQRLNGMLQVAGGAAAAQLAAFDTFRLNYDR